MLSENLSKLIDKRKAKKDKNKNKSKNKNKTKQKTKQKYCLKTLPWGNAMLFTCPFNKNENESNPDPDPDYGIGIPFNLFHVQIFRSIFLSLKMARGKQFL